RSDMTHPTVKFGLPLLVALVTGCTTMGTGFGSTASGTDPVNFSWKSSDSVSGSMNATLSDGTTFTGQFFQITSDTTVDNLGPLWAGWGGYGRRGRWGGDWGYWDAGPEFVTHYSGKVLANLTATDGQHMRCSFQLVHPSDGMAGGGRGQCQLPQGNTIDTTFPKA
ncbi:MAG TPA: hypothetical protein VGI23_15045, partial [Steroidobacteraceae bacterium]